MNSALPAKASRPFIGDEPRGCETLKQKLWKIPGRRVNDLLREAAKGGSLSWRKEKWLGN